MEISLIKIVSAALTIGVRVTGLMLFAPFFGSVAIPSQVKAVLVLVITAVLYPVFSPQLSPVDATQWPLLLLSEFAVGAGVGIATNLVFDAVQMAGQVLSMQMGFSLINILDPQTQVDTTVVALFHQTIAMLVFLRLDVHHWLLRAISNSFYYLPPGSAHLNQLFTTATLHVGARVFDLGLQIAAPVLSATLVADVLLGLLGKVSAQLPLMLLGPALKSLLSMTIMIAALKYWPDLFQYLFSNSMAYAEGLLHLAR